MDPRSLRMSEGKYASIDLEVRLTYKRGYITTLQKELYYRYKSARVSIFIIFASLYLTGTLCNDIMPVY